MLRGVASVLLLAALLTGVGGSVALLGAFILWLGVIYRSKIAPPVDSTAGALPSPASAGLALALVLAGIVATALLRWPIASHDVEHYPAPDEGEVVENVLEMMRMGDLDHRHPGYPGLHFYLQMIPAWAHLAATGGTIPELPRTGFYLGARRFSLVAGVLAAGVVFWIGCRLGSWWSAALAASLVALSPLAFRESAVVNPDLVLMFFVSVSLALSLRLLEARTWTSFLVAGIFVGLATAIKYTGVLSVAPFGLAWLLGRAPRRDSLRWLAGLVVSGITFVAASPYTLLNASAFVRGLTLHVGYYQAAEINAPLELTRQLATRGVGIVAALAALAAAARALMVLDRRLLVVLGYPVSYWLVFSFFDRTFPRHALVLIPAAALLAGDSFERLTRRLPGWARLGLGLVLVTGPLLGSIDLWRRAHRPTPADAAAEWVRSNLRPGSRILEDQHTPRLDSDTYRVRRIGVEEKVFVGNFDWVLRSGYPPGLRTRGLREVARFDNENALGDRIVAYQVPERESLMPRTFRQGQSARSLRAGDLAFFGEGWYPPAPGAFETSRLSRGMESEIFFLLDEVSDVDAELVLGAAVESGRLAVKLNRYEISERVYESERESLGFELPAETLESGLNRIVLQYDGVHRLDRRHPDTAIRFYRLNLRRE